MLAFRALASTTNTAQGESVPFVLLPDLGGSHTLRGYPSWRFRDRSRMALTAEYRWKAGHFVDMALFVDAGQVAPRLADLDSEQIQKDLRTGDVVSHARQHGYAHRSWRARARARPWCSRSARASKEN